MPVPAKRVEDMTEDERLQSLQDFAEERKYTRPGQDGTLPGGPRGMLAMAIGGPMGYAKNENGQYSAPIGPPSYEKTMEPEPEKKQGPVKRWLEKRKERKNSKDGIGEGVGQFRFQFHQQQEGERPPEYS